MTEDEGYQIAIELIKVTEKYRTSELSLPDLSLTKIPPEITKLHNLKNLYIHRNKLTEIPLEITKLQNLKKLSIGENQISEIPPEIAELKNLTELYMWHNQITKIPPGFSKLKNLKHLDINSNKLIKLPIEITKLKNLTGLNISRNQITKISPEITELKNLQTLDINNNQLTEISLEITKLKNLEILNIRNNQITKIPPEIIKLKNLKILNLRNNQITHIPPELLQLKLELIWEEYDNDYYHCINLYGNPLVDPPVEIIRQGNEAIANYFREKEKHGATKLFEAKLMVVGGGGVGKSWLLHRLVHDEIDESKVTTEGIDIHEWPLATGRSEDFRVNFWDFGGQEIYHATHQFFLTSNSLYLFLWEARSDSDMLFFDYWLNAIKIFSDNAPVLVIQSKVDERTKDLNQSDWKRRFDNIAGFYDVSAKKNTGIADLREVIKSGLDQLPQVGKELPSNWVDIRKELEALGENYIPWRDYLKICESHDTAYEQAAYLSDDFHTLGTFLHFKESTALKNWLFLKPQLVADAVYIATDNPAIKKAHGRFDKSRLRDIWRDHDLYPPEIHEELVELMKSFELCFELPGGEYILPELLKTNEPEYEFTETGNLTFQYKFDFMIKGLLTYLTVALHELIDNNLYWKDGMILAYEKSRARVRKNGPRLIEICVEGEAPYALLSIIRRELDRILGRFEHLQVDRLLPCICRECAAPGDAPPYMHALATTQKAIHKGRATIECKNSFDDVSIEEMLHGIGESVSRPRAGASREPGLEHAPRRLKVFIASGSDTEDERKALQLFFAQIFYDYKSRGIELEPVLWEDLKHSFYGQGRIQDYFNKKLAECDVAICLFKSKVGQYTKEELFYAWDNLKAKKNPQYLYVYFYEGDLNTRNLDNYNQVTALKKEIQQIEQIYGKYESPADLKLHVRGQMDLIMREMRAL